MRKSRSRFVIWGALAAALAFALRGLLAPPPVAVDLYRVARGPLQVTVADEGKTRLKELYTISAPISGRLKRIALEAGDPVEAGTTVLAIIEAPKPRFHDLRETSSMQAQVASAEAQRDLAQADIERAQAELAFAEADAARNRELQSKGATAARARDMAEMDLRSKRAALRVAQENLLAKIAEVRARKAELLAPERGAAHDSPQGYPSAARSGAPLALEKEPPASVILSPVNGVLLHKIHESETTVSAGERLLDVGDPRRLEIVVEMLSEDAVKVRPGAPASLTGTGIETPLRAVVRRVEPYGFTKISALGIEEQRVNVILDFADPASTWAPLGHGFRVDVAIVIWDSGDVLKVPLGALFRQGNKWAVYRIERDGTAHLREVEIGHTNDLDAEVLAGLVAGDTVVLHPSDRIAEGTRVVARDAS
jgi:HlyD family secretion protein